jgi:hypothetical protein
MPAINYLSELDRLKAKKNLQPIIEDMNERELRVALLYVIHGMDIYEAIDSARLVVRERDKYKPTEPIMGSN